MRKILMLSLALILIAGCSEDSVTPEATPFALNLIVTDAAGERLPGVEVRVDVEIPGWNPALNKSVTAVRFGVAAECELVLNIFDMEGRKVRTLGPEPAMRGVHIWAVTPDAEGAPLHGTGLYRYEMVASDSTGVRFRDEKIMTQYDSFDFDQRPVLGVTDDLGRISYADKTRFPFLYELGPQPGRDENNTEVGEFDFSSMAAFTLIDTLTNEKIVVESAVNPGLNIITLVWDEALVPKPRDFTAAAGSGAVKRDDPLPFEWFLSQNYPNPFN